MDSDDERDEFLDKAIEEALAAGKGWKDGEKEAYLDMIRDDDFIPGMFATTQEEFEKSGMADAMAALVYEGETPEALMVQFKKKGNDSFGKGKMNQAKNVQYYRDAINAYYEAIAWAEKIDSYDSEADFPPEEQRKTDDPLFTHDQLKEQQSVLYANAAMAHMMIKNWGFVRDNSLKAIEYNPFNVKAFYRLAKAYENLRDYAEAGDAIDTGLAIKGEGENKDLLRMQKLLTKKIAVARKERQKKERARAERVSKVKSVWKYCKDQQIKLGRLPLVATVTDDEDLDAEENDNEDRWNHHHPHTGRLPQLMNEWTWPVMFVYPAHGQSDFVEHFPESDMFAIQMAEIFPELEEGEEETILPWDYNNEYQCSNLAIYFEVHCTEEKGEPIHPESVQPLDDQGATMRFYEASRALKGDDGPDACNLVRAIERKLLHKQRKAWKKKHGSLWCQPGPAPVIQVHPAATLKDTLRHARMVVPNFLPTFILFPIDHPKHHEFLKQHQCVDMVNH